MLFRSPVKDWLDENTNYNGIFAGGGVNLISSRTQWLRISVANPNLRQFRRQIRQSVRASTSVLRNSSSEGSII